MNVRKYMEKYTQIAGLEKVAISRTLGKKVNLRGSRKAKAEDPGWLFLNSNQFIKIMGGEAGKLKPKREFKPTKEQLLDLFGREIGDKEFYE